jgi:hypothetical protein
LRYEKNEGVREKLEEGAKEDDRFSPKTISAFNPKKER